MFPLWKTKLRAFYSSGVKLRSSVTYLVSPDNEKTPALRGGEVGDDIILILDLGVPGIDFTTRISTTVLRIQRIRAPFNRFP
jgi:hypothetical protein